MSQASFARSYGSGPPHRYQGEHKLLRLLIQSLEHNHNYYMTVFVWARQPYGALGSSLRSWRYCKRTDKRAAKLRGEQGEGLCYFSRLAAKTLFRTRHTASYAGQLGSGSSDPEPGTLYINCTVFLGKTFYCFVNTFVLGPSQFSEGHGHAVDAKYHCRHLTLTVPLSSQVYKWVLANLMLGRVTLRWTNIPSRGGEEILPATSCYRNRR